MQTTKVLVIDDSRVVQNILESVLSDAGYMPIITATGEDGLAKFQEHQPHLVLLDISLPGISGWEVCRQIREMSELPIIMLSAAHPTVPDKIKGLDLGANDYIVKPFDQDELLARVRASLRVFDKLLHKNAYRDGFLDIDLIERRVTKAGRQLDLTEKEFALLSVLLRFASTTVSNEKLFEKVWGYPDTYDANYVRIYMSSLRKKLEPDPKNPTYIKTKRGVGYQFVVQMQNGKGVS
ncbi:MAG: response regulator transcription factor [Anaerolineales bacterium]|nr:response regulator transcription factor [Anaerolineales bacterium]